VVRGFQPLDRVAQRRLRDVEARGGTGEAALLGHGGKRDEVVDVFAKHGEVSEFRHRTG